MAVRRVVTAHRDGKAVFASDTEIEPLTTALMPGWEIPRLWGGDETSTFPDDGSEPTVEGFFPRVGGFRFFFVTVGPQSAAAPDVDPEVGMAEIEAKLPGYLAVLEPDEPGMHTTDTIDFEVMLTGEVVLELDDGAEKTIRPGDVVVQNGTRHRWINRTNEPAVFAAFLCGAHRRTP